MEIEVDGERFEVRERFVDGQTKMWDLDWITGPHAGYGFSTSEPIRFSTTLDPLAPFVMTQAHLISQARSFLESIDPETGYL